MVRIIVVLLPNETLPVVFMFPLFFILLFVFRHFHLLLFVHSPAVKARPSIPLGVTIRSAFLYMEMSLNQTQTAHAVCSKTLENLLCSHFSARRVVAYFWH